MLVKSGLEPPRLMVDCSHGNSNKDYLRQIPVCEELARQISSGSKLIAGVMLESHLVEGKQDYDPKHPEKAVRGKSITDACISLDQTEILLEKLAEAVRLRRNHRS